MHFVKGWEILLKKKEFRIMTMKRKVLLTLALACSGCAGTSASVSIPEAQSMIETASFKDAMKMTPVSVEGEIYGSTCNYMIAIDDQTTIQALLQDLDKLPVEAIDSTPNTMDFYASYCFTDEDGKRLLVCENNQLSLSGDDFTENTLYRCLEGTSLQAVMKNYIGEEPVYKSGDSRH